MIKKILITGATDGIGLETARMMASLGHHMLLHGRNRTKLESVQATLKVIPESGKIDIYVADLSKFSEVVALARSVANEHNSLDVLVNNAGVLKAANTMTENGLDIRFVVNTLAPYLLTQHLLPNMSTEGRVINLSSAAQAPVNLDALAGKVQLSDMDAYAQSKLAITMWSKTLAAQSGAPIVIAVNPGSLLGTRMVKEGFGTDGKDVLIGARILCRTALDDEFKSASGKYFDNDSGQLAAPHPDAMDSTKTADTVAAINTIVALSNS